ncbi:hypothetical protein GCM10027570_25590 [Streptomonospora sediminis]
MSDSPSRPDDPSPDPSERGRYPGGREYPRGYHAPGGYHLPPDTDEPALPVDPPPPHETGPGSEPPGGDGAPVAAERFRRDTPARRKVIPETGGKGYWRLGISTALFVMITAGSADYIPATTRAGWHLVFWALLGTAALAAVYRERRNGWDPAPRWPWPAAAIVGTVLTEVLVAAVGSPAVIVGSVVVGGIGLFLVMMFG